MAPYRLHLHVVWALLASGCYTHVDRVKALGERVEHEIEVVGGPLQLSATVRGDAVHVRFDRPARCVTASTTTRTVQRIRRTEPSLAQDIALGIYAGASTIIAIVGITRKAHGSDDADGQIIQFLAGAGAWSWFGVDMYYRTNERVSEPMVETTTTWSRPVPCDRSPPPAGEVMLEVALPGRHFILESPGGEALRFDISSADLAAADSEAQVVARLTARSASPGESVATLVTLTDTPAWAAERARRAMPPSPDVARLTDWMAEANAERNSRSSPDALARGRAVVERGAATLAAVCPAGASPEAPARAVCERARQAHADLLRRLEAKAAALAAQERWAREDLPVLRALDQAILAWRASGRPAEEARTLATEAARGSARICEAPAFPASGYGLITLGSCAQATFSLAELRDAAGLPSEEPPSILRRR